MDIQKSATKVLEIMHGSIDLSELYSNIPKLWEKSKNESATKVLEIMHGSIDLSDLYPNIPKLCKKSKNDFSSRWCGGGARRC